MVKFINVYKYINFDNFHLFITYLRRVPKRNRTYYFIISLMFEEKLSIPFEVLSTGTNILALSFIQLLQTFIKFVFCDVSSFFLHLTSIDRTLSYHDHLSSGEIKKSRRG